MMKRFLWILVMLLWCNVGFAEDIYLSCSGTTSSTIILNDDSKTLTVDGEHVEILTWNDNFIKFKDKYGIKLIDRIQGIYKSGAYGDKYCFKTSGKAF